MILVPFTPTAPVFPTFKAAWWTGTVNSSQFVMLRPDMPHSPLPACGTAQSNSRSRGERVGTHRAIVKQDQFGHSNVDFNSQALMLEHVVHLSKSKENVQSWLVEISRASNSWRNKLWLKLDISPFKNWHKKLPQMDCATRLNKMKNF